MRKTELLCLWLERRRSTGMCVWESVFLGFFTSLLQDKVRSWGRPWAWIACEGRGRVIWAWKRVLRVKRGEKRGGRCVRGWLREGTSWRFRRYLGNFHLFSSLWGWFRGLVRVKGNNSIISRAGLSGILWNKGGNKGSLLELKGEIRIFDVSDETPSDFVSYFSLWEEISWWEGIFWNVRRF